MSMIQIKNLTFGYPGSAENVFENLNLSLDTDWRLGLIGRNGRGKTTLLRLLCGEYDFSGSIRASVSFARFPPEISDPSISAQDFMHITCPEAEDWQIMRELSLLDVADDVLYRPYETLSGGEQTKLGLAALFLREDCFPLIDEPTDHLDAAGRAIVADYLRRKQGFLLVSHDRAFLDGCVDHILSINRSSVDLQAGNYSAWRQDFERREQFERAQEQKLRRDIAQLNESARRSAGWSDKLESTKRGERIGGLRPDTGYIGHKSAKLMRRAKAAEARRERAIEEKSALLRDVEESEALKLSPLTHHSQRLAELRDVCVRYGERAVCEGINLSILRGERVALDGANGCGKSSLIKLIAGEDIPHSGEISRASGLAISRVPQDTSRLRGSVFDLAEERGIDRTLYLAILRKLGFPRSQFEYDLSRFSQGQKKKALIAASLCERAHLYIWDEPLNYLDIDARLQIEALILQFQPTMLFVEHDRAFREAVATRVIHL